MPKIKEKAKSLMFEINRKKNANNFIKKGIYNHKIDFLSFDNMFSKIFKKIKY